MADGGKSIAKLPLSWKKSFSRGVVILHKMRNCVECSNNILCENCDNLVNQKEKFSENPAEIKRQPPNEFG